jgi:hypothetical protein
MKLSGSTLPARFLGKLSVYAFQKFHGEGSIMTIDRMECVVVGAGTAAAAIARRLAIAGREVMLIARRDRDLDDAGRPTPAIGWPEPVEAPILERPGTRRADLCSHGVPALKSYCQINGIPFATTGQLIIARNATEMKLLGDLKARLGDRSDVELLDASTVATMERSLKCAGALLAGQAGIVDGDALRLGLRIDAENRGAFVTEDSRLITAYPMGRGFELDLAGQPGELTTLRCEFLINAAEAPEAYHTASRIDGMRPHLPSGTPPGSTGKRYHLEGTAPFGRLVVPGCRGAKASALFFPGFHGESWMDVAAPRDENADWEIQTANSHGIRGLINVFGMDERKETAAALALGDVVIDGLTGRTNRASHPLIIHTGLVTA